MFAPQPPPGTSGHTLVNAQQRLQLFHGALVHVQVVRQQLADGRAAAGLVDGARIARPEQQVVGLPACLRIGPEKGPHVGPQAMRQLR
jgi:hypothetical protein